jgi:hypothetical protein
MKRERTMANARASYEELGVFGLSVWSAPDLDVEGIAQLARSHGPEYLPHSQARASTVGQLKPYTLHVDEPEGHYLLKLPTVPADADWDALEQAFSDPQPIPRKED